MYEFPETIADGTPIEPCGDPWLVVYEKDGTRKLVTSEESADHPSWIMAYANQNYNFYDGIIKSESKNKG